MYAHSKFDYFFLYSIEKRGEEEKEEEEDKEEKEEERRRRNFRRDSIT